MRATTVAVCASVLACAVYGGDLRIGGVINADTAVKATTVTGSQSNTIATALQPGATNGLLQAEADTLQSVAARGGFAGSEEIGPLLVTSQMYGIGAGDGASGDNWYAFGYASGVDALGDEWSAYGNGAGASATGSYWCANGYSAGGEASGDFWGAYGYGSGAVASGDLWGAYGCFAGYLAAHTNSHAFGRYAGRTARGNNRLYLDVYSADPNYTAGGAINDMIFGDNGYLYLGRGSGAPGGAQGGTLRGTWVSDSGSALVDAAQLAATSTADRVYAAGIVAASATRVEVTNFLSAGNHTWTKPAGCLAVDVRAWGGGGGGGAGGRGANYSGGGGGSGGSYVHRCIPAVGLGETEAVVVGAGGLSIAGRSNDGVGDVGNDGGNTTFGSIVTALGGDGGAGGVSSATAAGGVGNVTRYLVHGPGYEFGGAGGGSVYNAGASSGYRTYMAGGGGGSGGGNSTARAGGAGGADPSLGAQTGGGGAAGAAATAGTIGDSRNFLASYDWRGGAGGGGGGSATAAGTAAGAGATGGFPAAGGGGGGASETGASGAGGGGTNGAVVVVMWCQP